MKISYGITVHNEAEELLRLLTLLNKHIDTEDEIVVIVDGDDEKVEAILGEQLSENKIKVFQRKLDGDFAAHKNFVIEKCSGDYIFHIDADEYPNEILLVQLKQILEINEVDLIWIPRVNTVDGITEQHLQTWGWQTTEKGWINYPDYQSRVYKNSPSIRWVRPVHEQIQGAKTYAHLPPHEELSLYHPKTIDKQEQQNNLYHGIFTGKSKPTQQFEGMKNFMVFVNGNYKELLREGDTDYSNHEKTENFLRAQIDNSLDFGWKPNDIIIATNFDFEYRGVKTYIMDEICDYSQYFHKQYALLECMKKGMFGNKNIWYHDLDAFQVNNFEFPIFDGDWGTCVYPGGDGHSLQCGVMYFKPTAQDIFEEMVQLMKEKKFGTHDDEVVSRNFGKLNPKYSNRISVINTRWNVGMTGFKNRYGMAMKPINVVHFHPDKQREWDVMAEGKNEHNVQLIDERLQNIFKKHNLTP